LAHIISLTLVIIRVTFDVVLLPVAKCDLRHAHALVAAATQAMLLVRQNPNSVARFVTALVLADVNDRALANFK